MSNPYKAADSFAWGNPPDYPDPPEFDMVPEGCYMSACCGSEAYRADTVKPSYKCECCQRYCRIDEEESVLTYIHCIEQGGYDD